MTEEQGERCPSCGATTWKHEGWCNRYAAGLSARLEQTEAALAAAREVVANSEFHDDEWWGFAVGYGTMDELRKTLEQLDAPETGVSESLDAPVSPDDPGGGAVESESELLGPRPSEFFSLDHGCLHGYDSGCPDCDVPAHLPEVLAKGDRRILAEFQAIGHDLGCPAVAGAPEFCTCDHEASDD